MQKNKLKSQSILIIEYIILTMRSAPPGAAHGLLSPALFEQ